MRKSLTITLLGLAVFARSVSSVPAETAVPYPGTYADVDAPGRGMSPTLVVDKPARRWVIPQKLWTNTPRPVWLGGLRGQVTVIEFFRIGCSHCQDAAPTREALYRKYRKRGLRVIGFHSPGTASTDEMDWGVVKKTVRDWGLTYPIAFDKDRALFKSYGLRLYPSVFVLDRQGVIRYYRTGFTEETRRSLEQHVIRALARQPDRKKR